MKLDLRAPCWAQIDLARDDGESPKDDQRTVERTLWSNVQIRCLPRAGSSTGVCPVKLSASGEPRCMEVNGLHRVTPLPWDYLSLAVLYPGHGQGEAVVLRIRTATGPRICSIKWARRVVDRHLERVFPFRELPLPPRLKGCAPHDLVEIVYHLCHRALLLTSATFAQ